MDDGRVVVVAVAPPQLVALTVLYRNGFNAKRDAPVILHTASRPHAEKTFAQIQSELSTLLLSLNNI